MEQLEYAALSGKEPGRKRWWAEKDDAGQASALWGTFGLLREKDSARRRVQALYMRMYGDSDARGSAGTEMPFVRMLPDGSLTLQVAARVVQRALSRVIVNRPKAVFQTVAGNASLRRQARYLERFVDGEFYRLGVPKEALVVAEDAAALGKGLMKVYRAPGPGGKSRAFIERVQPLEITVDALAGRYGRPQEMYQVKFYPRDIDPGCLGVADEDQDRVAVMLAGADAGNNWADTRDPEADQVAVVEGWHLPDPTWDGESEEGAGLHVMALSNGCVFSEPWRYRYFPFVEMDWGKPLWGGFWGKGLIEQVAPLQLEINKNLLRIQQAMHLVSVPRILAEAGSRVTPSTVTNQIAQLLFYVGSKPEFMVAQAMHPEVYQHTWQLYQRAMELAGDDDQPVPRQIRSGVGLTKAHAMQSLRLARPIQAWDEFHRELATRIVDIYREIAADEGFTAVMHRDKYSVEEADWSEVDLDKETYVLRVYPASALSQDPVSRQEQVTELLQNGLVTPETGARLLDFPDLEQEADLARAAADNIDRQIEAMVDDGNYQPPEPYQDLALAIKRAQATYNRIERDDPSEEREDRLQLLRDYMNAAMELVQRAAMQAQAAAAPAPVAPGATPPGTPPAPGPAGASPLAAGGPV